MQIKPLYFDSTANWSNIMPKKKGKKHRKHTPIVSEKQRGFFGAELARKKAGKKTRTKMSQAELKRHLKESKGKKLPAKTGRKKKR